jgi:hypothetical protein
MHVGQEGRNEPLSLRDIPPLIRHAIPPEGGVASSLWSHLFDHHRLTQVEWAIVQEHLATKMESARLYAMQVRLVALQGWWGRVLPRQAAME